nr:hypothetical protein [uncultured Aureimonas sp.]
MPAAPHETSCIERIVEDADELLRVAADGRGVPLPAAGAGHPLLVQARGDLDGRQAGGEPREYPANHRCLPFVDLEQPALDLPVSVEPHHALVAIGAATSEASGKHGGFHATQRLVDKMLEEDRTEQPSHRELDLVDMAFADGMELDAVIGELLAQPGHILCITRKPVERLADDDVDLARFHGAQQLLQTRTIAAITRQLWIQPRRDDRTAQIADQRPARRDLVCAR